MRLISFIVSTTTPATTLTMMSILDAVNWTADIAADNSSQSLLSPADTANDATALLDMIVPAVTTGVLLLIIVIVVITIYCLLCRHKSEGSSAAPPMFESDPTVLARLRDAALPADVARDTRPEAPSARDFDKGHKGPLVIDVVQSADMEHHLDQISATPAADGQFVFDTDANEIYEFGSGIDVLRRKAPTKTVATAVSATTAVTEHTIDRTQ